MKGWMGGRLKGKDERKRTTTQGGAVRVIRTVRYLPVYMRALVNGGGCGRIGGEEPGRLGDWEITNLPRQ
jgi:hypothetical protein